MVRTCVGQDEIAHPLVHEERQEGLLVPVVRDADTKRLRALAREIFDLASRAKSRQLSPDEIQVTPHLAEVLGQDALGQRFLDGLPGQLLVAHSPDRTVGRDA
jgi:hypothetical protein